MWFRNLTRIPCAIRENEKLPGALSGEIRDLIKSWLGMQIRKKNGIRFRDDRSWGYGIILKKGGGWGQDPIPSPFQTLTVVALHSRPEVTFVPGQTRQNCNS